MINFQVTKQFDFALLGQQNSVVKPRGEPLHDKDINPKGGVGELGAEGVANRWNSLTEKEWKGLAEDKEVLSLLKRTGEKRLSPVVCQEIALHLSGLPKPESESEWTHAIEVSTSKEYFVKPDSAKVLQSLLQVKQEDDPHEASAKLSALRTLLVQYAEKNVPGGGSGDVGGKGQSANLIPKPQELGQNAVNVNNKFRELTEKIKKKLAEAPVGGREASEPNSLGKSEPAAKQPTSAFEALASGQLDFIAKELSNTQLTGEQVLKLLTPRDGLKLSGLKCLIGITSSTDTQIDHKRKCFKAYVDLLNKHAPRLTAVQLQALYKYLHEAQGEPRNYFRHNSKAFNEMMEEKTLYQQFKNVKTMCKKASLPGRAEGEDRIYQEYDDAINKMKEVLEAPALTSEERFDFLAASGAESFVRKLLNEPRMSAFSIDYKRAALKKYMGVLSQAAPQLFTEQRRSLYKHLHDLQKSSRFARKHADYRAMMKDLELYSEYKALKNSLKVGEPAKEMKVKESKDSDKEGDKVTDANGVNKEEANG